MSQKTIPEECIMLLSANGFYKRWQFHTTESKNYKEAYFKTEKECYKYFKTYKYKTYNSFINSKNKKRSKK